MFSPGDYKRILDTNADKHLLKYERGELKVKLIFCTVSTLALVMGLLLSVSCEYSSTHKSDSSYYSGSLAAYDSGGSPDQYSNR
jgi:hypothetical protein